MRSIRFLVCIAHLNIDMQPSLIDQLPNTTKAELDKKLIESGFSGYRELSQWLTDQGFEICKSSIGKYGKGFKDRLAALKLSHDFAIAYKEALPDDAGARAEVLTELAQDSLFNLLLQLQRRAQDLGDDDDLTGISKLISTTSRAISDVNRSGVTIKKYAAEVKEKQRNKLDELSAQAATRGIDLEFMNYVRSEVLRLL
jgi:Protein of unknown function (DUF3486)